MIGYVYRIEYSNLREIVKSFGKETGRMNAIAISGKRKFVFV